MPTPLRSTKGRIRSVACERGDYAPLSTFQTTCAKRWEIVVCLRWNRAGVGRPVARRRTLSHPRTAPARPGEVYRNFDRMWEMQAVRSRSPIRFCRLEEERILSHDRVSRIRYQIASSDPSSCSAMQRSNILSIAPTSYLPAARQSEQRKPAPLENCILPSDPARIASVPSLWNCRASTSTANKGRLFISRKKRKSTRVRGFLTYSSSCGDRTTPSPTSVDNPTWHRNDTCAKLGPLRAYPPKPPP